MEECESSDENSDIIPLSSKERKNQEYVQEVEVKTNGGTFMIVKEDMQPKLSSLRINIVRRGMTRNDPLHPNPSMHFF